MLTSLLNLKKPIFATLFIISIVNFSFAQSDITIFINTLEENYQKDPKDVLANAITVYEEGSFDSVEDKLKLGHFIANSYSQKADAKKAMIYLEDLFNTAKKTKNHYYLSLYWLMLSEHRSTKDKEQGKLIQIIKAQRLIEEHKIESLKSKLQFYLGGYYRQVGNFNQALAHYKLSVSLAKTDREKANALTQLGTVFKKIQSNEKALRALNEALITFTKLNDETGISNVLYNLAGINNSVGNHDLAVKQYIQTAEIDKKLGARNNYAYSQVKLCNTYVAVYKLSLAQKACLEGKKIFNELNAKSSIAWANSILASIW